MKGWAKVLWIVGTAWPCQKLPRLLKIFWETHGTPEAWIWWNFVLFSSFTVSHRSGATSLKSKKTKKQFVLHRIRQDKYIQHHSLPLKPRYTTISSIYIYNYLNYIYKTILTIYIYNYFNDSLVKKDNYQRITIHTMVFDHPFSRCQPVDPPTTPQPTGQRWRDWKPGPGFPGSPWLPVINTGMSKRHVANSGN